MKRTILALTIIAFVSCSKNNGTDTPTNPVDTPIALTGDLLFQRIYYGVANEPGEIFKLNTATGAETQLTSFSSNGTLNKNSQDAVWNSAKTKISFSSTKDNVISEIYSANADGTSVIRLTNNSLYDYSPKFSPDGTKIAFLRIVTATNGAADPTELFIMNSDGTNEIKLTNVSSNGSQSKRVEGIYWNGNSELFFTSNKDYTRNDIYKINSTNINIL